MKYWIGRHSLPTYLGMTFVLSWSGALALLLPELLQGAAIPTWYGLLTFPVMLLGPALASIGLTLLLDGRTGLRQLFARMRQWRAPGVRYLLALVAPLVVLVLLFGLTTTVSTVFAPRLFPLGFLFGPIAGFVEEIGWTGFALPRLRAQFGTFRGSLLLGVIWGAWHLPIIDVLGSASPHGAFLIPFFFAFVIVVTAMRVLLGAAAAPTNSVPLAQVLHASLTGSLAMVSPAGVSPAQETTWYALAGAGLWLAALATYRVCINNIGVAPRRLPSLRPMDMPHR